MNRLLTAWTTALLLLPAALPAKKASAPPEPGPTREVAFPEFREKTLPNGLRVVVIEHHEQPSVSLRLVLRAGQLYEPTDQPGLAQATAALLDQGTAKRSAQEIAEAIDFVGGGLSAGAGRDSTFASAFVTSDQLDLGLELLSDIVLRPSFPETELERWRTRTLNGLQVQFTDPSFLASAAFDRALYGEHPYGQPGGGTPESVRAFTREDLEGFHRRTYLPNTAILAVVGDVTPETAFAKVEKAFGGWAKGEAPDAPEVEPSHLEGRKILVIDKPDAVQTEIRAGQPALAYTDPDFFVAQVYNSVVGGGVSARLYTEIRQKRGLSYGAGSSFTELRQPGYFQARTFTKTETTAETVALVLEVLAGMREELVPAGELEDRKTYITGAFPLAVETPDGIATRVLTALSYGKDKAYLDSYNGRIQDVDAEEVMRFATRRVDPARMLVVLAGAAEGFLETLDGAELGAIEVVPMAELDLMQASLRRPAESAVEVSEEDRERAMQLLARAVEAQGGEAFTGQKSQVTRGTGSLTLPGAPQPMPITALTEMQKLPSKRRLELQLPPGQMLQAFDGEVGWISMMGQVQDQSAAMQARAHYGLGLLRRLDEGGWSARPLASEDLDGTSAKVVELADSEGRRTEFLLDPETHRVLATRFELLGNEVFERYRDHRLVEGVLVPHSLEISQNGSPMIEILVEEVEVDPELDDSLFSKPEG